MCEEAKSTVLVVGSVQSYLPHSVIAHLEKNDLDTCFSNGDIDFLSNSDIEFNAVLIFVDEDLLEQQHFLIYLRDKVVDQDIAVFTIGYEEEQNRISDFFPMHIIEKQFIRPVNGNAVVNDITTYLKEHDVKAKKKILVVDDSATTLRSLRTLLGDKYQVILANSGAMAIKYLALDEPDLVLLDYEMPIINGKQVLEMIRSEMEFANTPVIFLTSHGDKQTIMDVMHLKPEGYLLKTMELRSVEKAIDEFFAKQESNKGL